MKQTVSGLGEWLLVSAVSMVAMAIVYPDLLVSATVRFTSGHDIQIPFQSAWVQAGYFLRDGFQLWNRLDQVNHAYFHLGTGFFSFPAIVEGWSFAQIASLLDRPGEAFQSFHALVFFGLTTLFRTAGGLALLSLYRIPFWPRLLALVLANTLLAAQAWDGLMMGFLYCLAPMVLYFVVVFFRSFSLVAAAWVLLALGLAFAQIPLIALGYFYLPIHLFIVTSAIAFVIWGLRARRQGQPFASEPAARAGTRQLVLLGIGYCALAVIVAMNIRLYEMLGDTFYVFGSGLTGTSGRFENLLRPLSFLDARAISAVPADFFRYSLDFSENRGWFSWSLLGSASLGLSIIGLTHGSHRERWLFAIAILLLISLQFQPGAPYLYLPAGLITGFTDPFSFLLRHLHMSTLELPYFLIPLIGLGATALAGPQIAARTGSSGRARDVIAIAALLALAAYAVAALPVHAGLVSAAVLVALAVPILVAAFARPTPYRWLPRAALAVAAAAVIADLYGYSVYLTQVPYTGDRIHVRTFDGIETDDERQINPVVIDYQNPATLQFPRHVRVAVEPVTPTTDPGFPVAIAMYFIPQTYQGAFYNTVFLSRAFKGPTLYELRHIRYRHASPAPDPAKTPDEEALYPVLSSDDRALYFAPVGVDAEAVGLAALRDADAATWAVSLEAPDGGGVDGTADALPETAPELPAGQDTVLDFAFSFDDAVFKRKRDGFVEYDFDLPDGFPGYMATNLFSADRDDIRAYLGERELSPAQGRLIRPFTFDVRNVATDRLVVAVPDDQDPGAELRLRVSLGSLLKSVDPNLNDSIGLQVEAPADGWLVWRNPYEDGWTATVDGQPVDIAIANMTAMAVPVHAGTNAVEFSYRQSGLITWLVAAQAIAGPVLALLVLGATLAGACGRLRRSGVAAA